MTAGVSVVQEQTLPKTEGRVSPPAGLWVGRHLWVRGGGEVVVVVVGGHQRIAVA